LSGAGFSFDAPSGWKVTRSERVVQAADGDRAVSVTVFRLTHPYRPELWPRVVTELDGVARGLADQLRGTAADGATVTVAGRRARRYDVRFQRDGRDLVERITFVLEGLREYQLLCRYRAGADERACAALGSSFRLR
jgi:predicted Zn-dependent protease